MTKGCGPRGKNLEALREAQKRKRNHAVFGSLSETLLGVVASYLPAIERASGGGYVPSAVLARLARPGLPRSARDLAIRSVIRSRLSDFSRSYDEDLVPPPFAFVGPAVDPRAGAQKWPEDLWPRYLQTKEKLVEVVNSSFPELAQMFGDLLALVARGERRTYRVPSDAFGCGSLQRVLHSGILRHGDRVLLSNVVETEPAFLENPCFGSLALVVEGSSAGARPVLKGFDVRSEHQFAGSAYDPITVLLKGCDVSGAVAVAGAGATLRLVDVHVRCRAGSGVTAGRADAEGLTRLEMARCAVRGCLESGVFLRGAGTRAAIEDCSFAANGASGLSVHEGAEAVATRCEFVDNKENGVTSSGGAADLRCVTIRGNRLAATSALHGGSVARCDACDINETWCGGRQWSQPNGKSPYQTARSA